MKRFYTAIRGRVTSPGPARPVFRANTDMMLLTTRLRMDKDGKPHIPGNLDVWKALFISHPAGKYDAKLSKAAPSWKDPDDVLEALFGLSRKAVENEPLKIFMALSDVERNRITPLDANTVDRLAREYHLFHAQYPLFSEAPAISDKTIVAYLDSIHAINKIGDQVIRADAVGPCAGALAGLWQIFVRQGSIPVAQSDQALARILEPFQKIQGEREIFDGGRNGIKVLFEASASPKGVSPQDRMMDLLAGTGSTESSDAREQLAQEMIRVFEAQRLVSLSTIFDLADNLESVTKGGVKFNTAPAGKSCQVRISDINLPRNTFTSTERNSLAFGYYTEVTTSNRKEN